MSEKKPVKKPPELPPPEDSALINVEKMAEVEGVNLKDLDKKISKK